MQVQYVLSDKTGTLTKNVMKLRRCSVGGMLYGAPLTNSLNPEPVKLDNDSNSPPIPSTKRNGHAQPAPLTSSRGTGLDSSNGQDRGRGGQESTSFDSFVEGGRVWTPLSALSRSVGVDMWGWVIVGYKYYVIPLTVCEGGYWGTDIVYLPMFLCMYVLLCTNEQPSYHSISLSLQSYNPYPSLCFADFAVFHLAPTSPSFWTLCGSWRCVIMSCSCRTRRRVSVCVSIPIIHTTHLHVHAHMTLIYVTAPPHIGKLNVTDKDSLEKCLEAESADEVALVLASAEEAGVILVQRDADCACEWWCFS